MQPQGQPGQPQQPQQPPPQPINLNFNEGALDIVVSAGVNFDIQKSEALQTMTSLMANVPSMAEIINTKGLPILIDNLDIRGGDQLKVLSEQFVKEQAAQSAQQKPNPQMIELQLKQQQVQQTQQRLQLEAQDNETKNTIAMAQLALDRDKLNMQKESAKTESDVQMAKASTERETMATKLAMDMNDQTHQHALDFADRASKLNKPTEEKS
jgi:hypothetical protein